MRGDLERVGEGSGVGSAACSGEFWSVLEEELVAEGGEGLGGCGAEIRHVLLSSDYSFQASIDPMDDNDVADLPFDSDPDRSETFVDANSGFDINHIDSHQLIERSDETSSSATFIPSSSTSCNPYIPDNEPVLSFLRVEDCGIGALNIHYILGEILANTDLRKSIHKLVWNLLIDKETFEERWHELLAKYDLTDHEWLSKIYEIRSEWVPAFFRDVPMSCLMKTTSRSESSNTHFKVNSSLSNTLLQFLMCFDTALDWQRNNQRKMEFETNTTTPELRTPLPIERHAAAVYTSSLFKKVQKEIKFSLFYFPVGDTRTVGDTKIYTVSHNNKNFVTVNRYEVSFNVADQSVMCSCLLFPRIGYLCRHVYHVFRFYDINRIPDRYINRRWTHGASEVRGVNTKDGFIGKVKEAVKYMKEGTWLLGGGWNNDLWGGELPSASWIDDVTPNHPLQENWVRNMGNTHHGLGTCLVFICIVFGIVSQKCTGGGNLTTTSCSEEERLALLKFKHSVKDEYGILSSWGVGNDCCSWERVGCDDATGRVVSLHLRRNVPVDDPNNYLSVENVLRFEVNEDYLVGDEVSSCLKELVNLEHLDLSFSGNIPHQIGNLSNLKILDLSSKGARVLMIDDMAWVSGLSKLEHLDLSGMDLNRTQNLDSLLFKMPSLLKLRLSWCGLTLAHLGSHHLNSSRELVGIRHLDLSKNDFKGQLPGLFLNMTSLAFVDLSCQYSSPVSMLWSFKNLQNMIPFVSELHLSGCEIQKVNLSPTNHNFSTHSNIQHLDLSANLIEGQIPFVLTNMSSLLSLDLSMNKLNSPIPFMPNLLKLDISQNKFRHIEDIGIWRQCNLKELIDHNKLNCSVPESFGRFTNLRRLDLSFNELTGQIPEALGKLNSSTTIFLNSNRFTGSIPVSLGRLTSLRVLSVSSNLLNETIPNSIGKLSELILLDVSNNSLQGVISEDHFANLSMLKYLDANSNNKLVFNISQEWIPPFQLKVLRLGSCRVEDEFPEWLRTQRKLEELVLFNTGIYGPLPIWLCLMPIMRVLDLSHNNLTGKIPKCLWNMSLYVMLLGSNRLSGVIPSSVGPMNPSLAFLQLSNNNMNGELPQDVGDFRNLQVLDLGENKISGNIPKWMGENMTGLRALRLHKNNFTGLIPHSLCKSHLLQILDLAYNNLTGSIPSCFGELVAMKSTIMAINYYFQGYWFENMIQVLKGVELEYTRTLKFVTNMDLSSNKLVEDIPETLTTLKLLVGLNLSYNHFTGSIPKNIGNMKSLNSLDLSTNKLTGMIPSSMAALNFLSFLNLSHNNFSGQIPKGNQLQTLTDPSIYAYNTYLCGAPLAKECAPHESPPTTNSKKYENDNDPKNIWFYLDIMSGFATGFWGIILVLLFKKQWRHKFFMFMKKPLTKIYLVVMVGVLKTKRGCIEFK
ncbi:hypothetical protein SSX86_017787 [Deinandra increscens subsp. villosa]|uniref:SWIM-type domain-containing protein n=1 Tax=Deinandra increscens subsp. villosa TaxID=3103831 RepID=A0AAP0GYW9_9ASTR